MPRADRGGKMSPQAWQRLGIGGFMHGMHMLHDGRAELVNDDEHGSCLIPMMMLRHEHEEEPEMRSRLDYAGEARVGHRENSGGATGEPTSISGCNGRSI